MLRVWVNGEVIETTNARTITDLVSELRLTPSTVLIELNGNALVRSDWPLSNLASGDRIEILRVSAGG